MTFDDVHCVLYVHYKCLCKMQTMLQILSMMLHSMTTDEMRFDNKHEMNVDDGLHGWMEDVNWWVHLMTW
jgi:hypothetical protein